MKITWGVPATPLSIAVVSSKLYFCQELAAMCDGTLVRQVPLEPGSDQALATELASDSDAIIVDLDPFQDRALALISAACVQNPVTTVVACSANEDPELLVRCMRAGARDLLRVPLSATLLNEALGRAATRRTDAGSALAGGHAAAGKVMLFSGAKGGCGVTTVAVNFALALKQESGQDVVLADFSLPLGDAATLLSITPQFTIADALVNIERLDAELLRGIVVKHGSGLALLPASDRLSDTPQPASDDMLAKLVRTLKSQFKYVVIDGGRAANRAGGPLLDMAEDIFLVAQADVASLRHSQRFVSQLRKQSERAPDLVLNRFHSRNSDIGEDQVTDFLGLRPAWKFPNEPEAVREAENTGRPFVTGNSLIAIAIRNLARSACGKPEAKRTKRLSLFGR